MPSFSTFATCVFVVCVTLTSAYSDFFQQEMAAQEMMDSFNLIMANISNRGSRANWAFESNMNEANKKNMVKVKTEVSAISRQLWLALKQVNWMSIQDPTLRREFMLATVVGAAALPPNRSVEVKLMSEFKLDMNDGPLETEEFGKVVRIMKETYSKATVCDFHNSTNCNYHIMPDLEHIFAESRSEPELKHYWKAWRDASGRPSRSAFIKYIALKKDIAIANGIPDPVQMWNYYFEDPNFEENNERLWEEIKPLYEQLHAYFRFKLRKFYGPKVVSQDGPMPAHIVGNMWAQSWANVKEIVMDDPFFNGYKGLDVSEELHKQNYDVYKILREAEKFFVSLGFPMLPASFWENSIFLRPPGVDLNCHPSSWNLYNYDVRMKMCATIDEKNFITIHHEMGHVEYYLMYEHLPFIFRKGANQGFHEAIGDVVALNVQTNAHMEKIGLLNKSALANVPKKIQNIAHLLHIALEKIAFLPYGYLVDKYRWEVLRGNIPLENLNEAWWTMRNQYQGLEPPVPRSEEDFDAASKYHVSADSKYIIYFVSHILQFQIYKGLCMAADQYDPSNQDVWLGECDIYAHAAAGQKFRDMMSLGASQPWPETLEIVTGSRTLDARPLLEYFKPLYKWLKETNKKNNVTIGWGPVPRTPMMPSV